VCRVLSLPLAFLMALAPVLGLLVEEGSAQTDRASWLRTTLAALGDGEWRR